MSYTPPAEAVNAAHDAYWSREAFPVGFEATDNARMRAALTAAYPAIVAAEACAHARNSENAYLCDAPGCSGTSVAEQAAEIERLRARVDTLADACSRSDQLAAARLEALTRVDLGDRREDE